jgi:hypothetical protein
LYLIQNYKRRSNKRIKDVLYKKGIKKQQGGTSYTPFLYYELRSYNSKENRNVYIREYNEEEEDTTKTTRSL